MRAGMSSTTVWRGRVRERTLSGASAARRRRLPGSRLPAIRRWGHAASKRVGQTAPMVRTGARAEALGRLLEQIGFEPADVSRAVPRPSDLRDGLAPLLELYRSLGGKEREPTLRPGAWDLVFRGAVFVELDEELHFNRYRRLTLEPEWAALLPWHADYLRFTLDHEHECLAAGRWGKRWTNESCERLFGAADPPGDFTRVGAPRWKQRALYDAMKDLIALKTPEVSLVRLATVDVVAGVKLGDALEGRAALDRAALADLVGRRASRGTAQRAVADGERGAPSDRCDPPAEMVTSLPVGHHQSMPTSKEMSAALAATIASAVPPGSTIYTLTQSKPNWIVGVDTAGVVVETEASRAKGAGPQLVPGWMLQAGWDELSRAGQLSQTDLLERLNVKRSAAVMAILARLPGVRIASANPTVLTRS